MDPGGELVRSHNQCHQISSHLSEQTRTMYIRPGNMAKLTVVKSFPRNYG